jgi:hypothetical protein
MREGGRWPPWCKLCLDFNWKSCVAFFSLCAVRSWSQSLRVFCLGWELHLCYSVLDLGSRIRFCPSWCRSVSDPVFSVVDLGPRAVLCLALDLCHRHSFPSASSRSSARFTCCCHQFASSCRSQFCFWVRGFWSFVPISSSHRPDCLLVVSCCMFVGFVVQKDRATGVTSCWPLCVQIFGLRCRSSRVVAMGIGSDKIWFCFLV